MYIMIKMFKEMFFNLWHGWFHFSGYHSRSPKIIKLDHQRSWKMQLDVDVSPPVKFIKINYHLPAHLWMWTYPMVSDPHSFRCLLGDFFFSRQPDRQKVMHIWLHCANCTSWLKVMTMIKVIAGAFSARSVIKGIHAMLHNHCNVT